MNWKSWRVRFWVSIGPILFGTIFLTVGLGVSIALSQQGTFTCQRTAPPNQGYCTLIHDGFLGKDVREFSLSTLTGASVDANPSTDGSTTYRVVLVTTEGELPLIDVWSSDRAPKAVQAERVQGFLNNPSAASVEIHDGTRGTAYLFAGLFGGIGAIALIVGLVLFFKPFW